MEVQAVLSAKRVGVDMAVPLASSVYAYGVECLIEFVYVLRRNRVSQHQVAAEVEKICFQFGWRHGIGHANTLAEKMRDILSLRCGNMSYSKVAMARSRHELLPVDQLGSLDFRIWKAIPQAMAKAHAHPDIEINFLMEGSIRYFMGGRFYDIRTGGTAIFWAGMPHQSLAKSADLCGIWLTLPLGWLLRCKHVSHLVEQLLKGELIAGPSLPSIHERFQQWAREFGEGDPVLREIILAELEAYLSRVSIGLKGKRRSSRRSLSPVIQRVEAITVYLGSRYQQEISVDEVASAVGLHPKYLLTLFRRTCGMTLWDYVIRLRLAHAQRLLLTTDRTVLDVALEAGFGSASAFYQAFRKYESRTPAEFRRR